MQILLGFYQLLARVVSRLVARVGLFRRVRNTAKVIVLSKADFQRAQRRIHAPARLFYAVSRDGGSAQVVAALEPHSGTVLLSLSAGVETAEQIISQANHGLGAVPEVILIDEFDTSLDDDTEYSSHVRYVGFDTTTEDRPHHIEDVPLVTLADCASTQSAKILTFRKR